MKTKPSKTKYRNIFKDIVLQDSDRPIEAVAESYRKNVPDSLPIKEGTVLSSMSRLLPNFKDEGLTQDRLFVSEITDSNNSKYLTDVIYNRSHTSSETIFTSSSALQIDDELKKYFDCTALFRHNSITDSTGTKMTSTDV